MSNALTTGWNDAALYDAGYFIDTASGAFISVAANDPVNHRAMLDAVAAGAYRAATGAASLSALPATSTVAVAGTDTVTVTVPGEGIMVYAASSDVAKATVSPASGLSNSSGEVAFTVTGVATGESTVTFSGLGLTDTCVVTVS